MAVMGRVIHRATIVTSGLDKLLDSAHLEALRIFPAEMVTSTGASPANFYGTFVILPCGSKEGWGEKEEDNGHRDEFCRWVRAQAYDDGSNSLEVVDVAYGGDAEAPSAKTP